MITDFKQLFEIEFPYWFNKMLGIYLYYGTKGKEKIIQLSIWEYHKIKELKAYKDEWFSSWWKNIVLWKNY